MKKIIYSRLSQIRFWVVCSLTVLINSHAQSQTMEQANQTIVNSKTQILQMLRHPSFVRLTVSEPKGFVLDEYQQVELPNESAEHEEGVYRLKEANLTVWNTTPFQISVGGQVETRVLLPEQKFSTEAQCKAIARNFLKLTFSWFFESVETIQEVDLFNEDGYWRCEWRRLDKDGLPALILYADVRVVDGKIIRCRATRLAIPWKHRITPENAMSAAKKIVAEHSYLKGSKIVRWDIGGAGGKNFYTFDIEGIDKVSNRLVKGVTRIDAENGQTDILGGISFSQMPQSMVLSDRLPVWNERRLCFVSNRKLKNMPEWFKVPQQIFMQDGDGTVTYLTSDSSSFITGLFVSIENKVPWTVSPRNGWTYAFNTATGEYRVLGEPERPAAMPTISNDGKWAIVVANGHDKNSDSDLFADNLERDAKLALRGRLILRGTEEAWPIFSPDDKWLLFVRIKAEGKGATQTLCRLPAEVVKSAKMKTIEEKQVETIAVLPDAIQRLSIFPDGSKLLAQTDKGIQVVSVAEKKVTPLKFAAQTDAEVGAAVTNPIDGWAGPTDDRVTFSGQTKDKAGAIRRRIYSCRFDGTDLKAHTPKDNTPVEQYIFPETKKTAYDLAKEWALGEIAYDDKRKERSN